MYDYPAPILQTKINGSKPVGLIEKFYEGFFNVFIFSFFMMMMGFMIACFNNHELNSFRSLKKSLIRTNYTILYMDENNTPQLYNIECNGWFAKNVFVEHVVNGATYTYRTNTKEICSHRNAKNTFSFYYDPKTLVSNGSSKGYFNIDNEHCDNLQSLIIYFYTFVGFVGFAVMLLCMFLVIYWCVKIKWSKSDPAKIYECPIQIY